MKTAVVTGGNSGIGKATAIALAKKGYRVIIHGRDKSKTQAAAEEIKSASGSKEVEAIVADVSTIAGMKDLAAKIKEKTTVIDALVLSTGTLLPKRVVTADGLELGFAIQYLSRFVVAESLLPELQRSASARVVHVGAPVMKSAKIFFDDLSIPNGYSMLKGAQQAMLSNHLFVQEFAKRHPEIRTNIGHVGIAKTDIMREGNFFFRTMVGLFGASPEKAAKNFVELASDDKVDYSGFFLKAPGQSAKRDKIHFDQSLASQIWAKSLEISGLK